MPKEVKSKELVILPNDEIGNLKKGTVCTHPIWGRCIKKSGKGSKSNNGLVTIALLSNTEEVAKSKKKIMRFRETKLVNPKDKVLLI
ncbi:MAG: hypothetical protein QXR60_02385 [Candidatus Nanoarchaeia archaeon]